MIPAFQKDDALLADIAAASADEGTLHVWWLGQSGFLVQWRQERLLFDPYLSDSLTKKYAQTDKPHVRMTEICVDPARLTGITRVTASHVHTDHLDAETLVPLARENPGYRLYLPHPVLPVARQRLGAAHVKLCPLGDQNACDEDDWQLSGTVARHNEVVRDAQGNSHCIGFLVRCGPFRIFHSGDTLWDDEIVRQCLDFGPIDLAMLPINGDRPERGVAGNLEGTEAARLAKAIGAQLVIPCHYDMFEFNTASPDDFAAACRQLDQPFQILRCGEHLEMICS
ncbi:MAG: MBL fold metallo-hydrolase [Verrucomicrobiaceae bacterium]|nr:MBL fold metallo-hydrolase [Verrucomicrobiaceae bacterium]